MAKRTARKRPTLYDVFHKNPLSGKGVAKTDKMPRNFKNFFKLSWWHMGTIISVNLMFIFGNFPLMLGLLGASGLLSDTMATPSSSIFANLYGAIQSGHDPLSAAIYGIHGMPSEMLVTSNATRVMFALTFLIIFTWGFVNTGTTYILRNLIKGDPVFFWHDFFYAIKRNLRQGFFMGVIDLVLCITVGYALFLYRARMTYGWFAPFMFYFALFIAFIYFVMRFYMYTLMITFDLSIFKIIKNAFIFSSVGLKRNAAGFFGIFALVILDWYLLKFIMPLGLILPIILLYGYCAYIGSYVSWPKIKQIMVDPYVTKEELEAEEEEEERQRVFKDDMTEPQKRISAPKTETENNEE